MLINSDVIGSDQRNMVEETDHLKHVDIMLNSVPTCSPIGELQTSVHLVRRGYENIYKYYQEQKDSAAFVNIMFMLKSIGQFETFGVAKPTRQIRKTQKPSKPERIEQTRRRIRLMIRKMHILLQFYWELRHYSVSTKRRRLDSHSVTRTLLPFYPVLTYTKSQEDLFKNIWDSILVVALVFVSVYVPIRVCFIENPANAVVAIDWMLDAIFIFDIFLNFLSAYYDHNHQLQIKFQSIASNYVKGWFLIDLISVFPFDSVVQSGNQQYNRLFRLLRIPRLYTLVKFLKLSQQRKLVDHSDSALYEFLDQIQIDFELKRMLEIILVWLLSTHTASCFWQYADRIQNFSKQTWVGHFQIGESFLDLYSTAFYWATATITSIGFGDVFAINHWEYTLACLWMLIGMCFSSIIIGNIGSTMRQTDSNQVFYDADNQLKALQSRFYFPSDLIEQINEYTLANLHQNPLWELNKQEWKEHLHENIRRELDMFCLRDMVSQISFFTIDLNFTFEIMACIQFLKYHPRSVIYRKGDPVDQIFFVLEGEVTLETQMGTKLYTVPKGGIFGEQEMFSKGKFSPSHERIYFGIARQAATIIIISMEKFIKALQTSNQLFQYLGILAKKRESEIHLNQQNLIQMKQQERQRRDHMEKIADTYMPYDLINRSSPVIKKQMSYDSSLVANKKFLCQVLNKKKNRKELAFQRFRRVVKLVILANKSILKFKPIPMEVKTTGQYQKQPTVILLSNRFSLKHKLNKHQTTKFSNETRTKSTNFHHTKTNDNLMRTLNLRMIQNDRRHPPIQTHQIHYVIKNSERPDLFIVRKMFTQYAQIRSRTHIESMLHHHLSFLSLNQALASESPKHQQLNVAKWTQKRQLRTLDDLAEKMSILKRSLLILEQQKSIMNMQRVQFERETQEISKLLLKIHF